MSSGVFITPLDAKGKRKFPEMEAAFEAVKESGVEYSIGLEYGPNGWWDGFRHVHGDVEIDRIRVRMSKSRKTWITALGYTANLRFGDTLTIFYKVTYEGRCNGV